jgi:hypothetical protein
MNFSLWLSIALTLPAIAQVSPPPSAAAPSVVIDGAPVTFDQPAIEQAGRIFVPLRGVFERLGASVVFAGGQINATSGTHTIGLHVGEPTAVIDGVSQALESPPILVGGRVLVPLRFIANALGASVNFDDATQTAYINASHPTPPPPPPTLRPAPATDQPPPYAAPSNAIALRLIREEPARGTTIARLRPEISATFAEEIDPNTAHVVIDGRDVTTETYLSERSFVFDPTFDLPQGSHSVEVTGKTPSPAHESFRDHWEFTTGTAATRNYLAGVEPPNGLAVESPLTISGLTRPHSQVHVVATSSETVAHFSELASAALSANAVADDDGYFEVTLDLVDAGTGILDVRIASTATDGGIAVKTLRLRQ